MQQGKVSTYQLLKNIMTSWEILWDCAERSKFYEDVLVWASTAHGGARLSHPELNCVHREKRSREGVRGGCWGVTFPRDPAETSSNG